MNSPTPKQLRDLAAAREASIAAQAKAKQENAKETK